MSINVFPIKVTRFLFKNYCYLVMHSETKEAVLIDPAWEMDKIEEQLKIHDGKLKAVLLTHHHIDHVNLAESFAQKYGVPVRMSKIEIEEYGFFCSNLIPVDHPEPLVFGELSLRPFFTPGHTKGAICYFIEDNLFTGDTLFIEGCGICTGKGACPSQMFDSLYYLKNTLPQTTRIYPGHSFGKEPGQPFHDLLENNIYLHFKNRDQFIAFRMRPNQKRIFGFQ
ncbi:MAG: MBL fold metallo-hydrolase [Alphaproteobacteria bacterium]|nr:MBL fold metallo-hydrolase [Alphaproteobacteria bacterium]